MVVKPPVLSTPTSIAEAGNVEPRAMLVYWSSRQTYPTVTTFEERPKPITALPVRLAAKHYIPAVQRRPLAGS